MAVVLGDDEGDFGDDAAGACGGGDKGARGGDDKGACGGDDKLTCGASLGRPDRRLIANPIVSAKPIANDIKTASPRPPRIASHLE